MNITEENKQKYERLGIDLNKLKNFYIGSAKNLLVHLEPYTSTYTKQLKKVLLSFIEFQNKDLIDLISEIKIPSDRYDTFAINDILFDVCYPESEWME